MFYDFETVTEGDYQTIAIYLHLFFVYIVQYFVNEQHGHIELTTRLCYHEKSVLRTQGCTVKSYCPSQLPIITRETSMKVCVVVVFR